ncbi:MAG: class I SAM-dependent methyltransferase [Nanoarchaeota archaeon]
MEKRDYGQEYVREQVKAVEKPLKEAKESFKYEFNLLKKICQNKVVLDVGCGTGRPADKLFQFVKKLVGIDNNESVLKIARKNLANSPNVEILNMDAFNMTFPDNFFDVTYAAYNLIGSIDSKEKLLREILRVTKRGGTILIFTWKRDKRTTTFLRKYYSYLGFKVMSIKEDKTVLDKASFDRVDLTNIKVLLSNYCQDLKIKSVGPVWTVLIGVKA